MKINAYTRILATETVATPAAAAAHSSFSWHAVPYGTTVGTKVILSGGYGSDKKPRRALGEVVELKNGKAKIGITDEGTLKGYRGNIIVDVVR